MANSASQQTFDTAFPFEVSVKNQYQQEESAVFYIVNKFDPADLMQQVEIDVKVTDLNKYAFKGFGFGMMPSNPSQPSDQTTISPSNSAFVPDASQFNIAIAFRPGTLSKEALQNFTQTLQKSLSSFLPSTNCCVTNGPIIRPSDGAFVWYSAFENPVDITKVQQNNTINAISFMLEGISAYSGVGSRSSQIEFMFSNVLKNNEGSVLSFKRSQQVDIINHQGHSSIPLYFGVIGQNTLVNQTALGNNLKIYSNTIDNQPLQFKENTEIDFIFKFGDSENELMFFGNKTEVIGYSLNQNSNIPFPLLKIQSPYEIANQNESNSQLATSGQICIATTFENSQNLLNKYTLVDLESQWSIGQALFCGYANYIIGNISTIPVEYQITKGQFSIDNWNSIISKFLPGIPEQTDNGLQYNSICSVGLPDLTWGFQRQWWGWGDTNSSFDNVSSGFDSGNYFSDINFFNYVKENFDVLLKDFFGLQQGLTFGYNVILTAYIYPCRYIFDYWFCRYNNYLNNLITTFYNNNSLYLNSTNLVFDFSNIQLSGLDGVVMLQINVRNVDGYWDTEFQVPIIKKSPFLPFSNVTNANSLPANMPVGSMLIQQGQSGIFAQYPGDNTTNANLNNIPTQSGTWVTSSQFWSDTPGNEKRYTYVLFVKISNENTPSN